MSQLDAIMKQLKTVLAESGAPVANTVKNEEPKVDPKVASAALKDFLTKNLALVKPHVDASEDPKLVLERRKAISTFVGVPLTNNGVAVLPGIIAQDGKSHSKPSSHGHKDPHGKKSGPAAKEAEPEEKQPLPPVAPAPTIVMTLCPGCVQAEALAKSAAADRAAGIEEKPVAEVKAAEPKAAESKDSDTKATETKAPPAHTSSATASPGSDKNNTEQAQTPKPIGMDMGMSMSGALPGSASSFSKPISQQTDAPAQKAPEPVAKPAAEATGKAAPEASSKPKSVVASLFSAFGGNKQANTNSPAPEPSPSAPEAVPVSAKAVDASPAAAAPAKSAMVWFKHFQAVESALRIGDAHFADSVVSVLHEAAISLSAEQNILARVQSLRARVFADRKQYAEAEKILKETLDNLKGTKWESNTAAAYCWHALALCYKQQKNEDESAKAHKKAIEIAEASLGANDPETMQFKAPLM